MIVKICGIRTVQAAKAAWHAGADWLGFVFAPTSRRFIPPEQAADIIRQIGGAKKIGVFVDEKPECINAISEQCHLDYVQLHGRETAGDCERITRPVIKAFGFKAGFSLQQVNAYPAAFVLIDTMSGGRFGGVGKTFDWQSAKEVLRKIQKPLLIAGGLGIENIKQAVHVFHPYGIDVSSGVEEAGEQSVEKIKAFISEARQAQNGG